jgi:hypothetical protein
VWAEVAGGTILALGMSMSKKSTKKSSATDHGAGANTGLATIDPAALAAAVGGSETATENAQIQLNYLRTRDGDKFEKDYIAINSGVLPGDT